MKTFTIILLFFGTTLFSAFSLRKLSGNSQSFTLNESQEQEALYLPNGQALQFITFGYHNAVSQVLWFNTISYFGKHYRHDQNYRWLGHMCDLVTNLNPEAEHTYLFCSMMLAWEASEVDHANRLLSKAIEVAPTNWYWHYLRGFNYMFFSKDAKRAHDDFVAASTLPHRPLSVLRLAARNVEALESTEAAIEFLEDAIKRSSDTSVRHALQGRLAQLRQKSHSSVSDHSEGVSP